jgi:nucleotide-binding universal stress UspA family protein
MEIARTNLLPRADPMQQREEPPPAPPRSEIGERGDTSHAGRTVVELNRWIVVGMDFSDGALRALKWAQKLARATGANVACVHAYEDDPSTPASQDPSPALRQQIVDVVAQSLPPSGELRVDSIVRRGPPWDKLSNVATELGADIIVVGADGQRGASNEGFLGTVATRLVSRSPRSVVVVRT